MLACGWPSLKSVLQVDYFWQMQASCASPSTSAFLVSRLLKWVWTWAVSVPIQGVLASLTLHSWPMRAAVAPTWVFGEQKVASATMRLESHEQRRNRSAFVF